MLKLLKGIALLLFSILLTLLAVLWKDAYSGAAMVLCAVALIFGIGGLFLALVSDRKE